MYVISRFVTSDIMLTIIITGWQYRSQVCDDTCSYKQLYVLLLQPPPSQKNLFPNLSSIFSILVTSLPCVIRSLSLWRWWSKSSIVPAQKVLSALSSDSTVSALLNGGVMVTRRHLSFALLATTTTNLRCPAILVVCNKAITESNWLPNHQARSVFRPLWGNPIISFWRHFSRVLSPTSSYMSGIPFLALYNATQTDPT